MKRKFITLEISASDKDMVDTEICIKTLLDKINNSWMVTDGTVEVKIREDYISLYKQMNKTKKEIK